MDNHLGVNIKMESTMTTTPEQKAKKAAYMREWTAKNREKVRAAKRAEQQRNKEAYSARHKVWREQNKDHLSEYRDENRDQIKKKSKEWKNKNPERVKAHKALDYERHKEHINSRNMENYVKGKTDKDSWARRRVASIKCRCKQAGIEFDLAYDWVRTRLDSGCELSGLEFDLTMDRGFRLPSVDRIDPKGPYTMKNCRLVIWFLNRAKSDYNDEEVFDVYRRVIEKLDRDNG
jgi:hypothetical protein